MLDSIRVSIIVQYQCNRRLLFTLRSRGGVRPECVLESLSGWWVCEHGEVLNQLGPISTSVSREETHRYSIEKATLPGAVPEAFEKRHPSRVHHARSRRLTCYSIVILVYDEVFSIVL